MTCNAIITRPKKVYNIENITAYGKKPLAEELEEKGLVCHFPTIELMEAPTPRDFKALVLKASVIILASPSSIYFFHEHLRKIFSNREEINEVMKKISVGVIGKISANVFGYFFPHCRELIVPPVGNENAKTLAKILQKRFEKNNDILMNRIPEKTGIPMVLVPKGDISPTSWEDLLNLSPGIEVEERIIYENRLSENNKGKLQGMMGQAADWFFFSPSAVRGLMELTGANPEDEQWNAWCIGSTTEKACRKFKFRNIHTATQAKEEILLQEYLESLQEGL